MKYEKLRHLGLTEEKFAAYLEKKARARACYKHIKDLKKNFNRDCFVDLYKDHAEIHAANIIGLEGIGLTR